MNEEEREKKVKKSSLGKVGLILGINFAAIVAIFLFYFQFNGNPAIKINSTATVGDFQVYISSSKDTYLVGKPLDFKIYLKNLSSNYKDFEIYALSLKITNDSTTIRVFNASNVVKSQISQKSTILIYDIKDQRVFPVGNYVAKVLMNLDGKIVSVGKSFNCISDLSPSLLSSNDFVLNGQSEKVSLYIKNETSQRLNLDIQKVIFSLLNEKNEILSTNTVVLNTTLNVLPYGQSLAYDYQTKPLQNPGDYKLVAEIIGTRDMIATSVISVINKNDVNETSGIEIISDIPSSVESKMPVTFSISLFNDALHSRYIVLDSLTVIIRKKDVELYRFSSSIPHNLQITHGGKKVIFDSQEWKTLSLQEKGTYDLEVSAKIGNDLLSYHKKIQSL